MALIAELGPVDQLYALVETGKFRQLTTDESEQVIALTHFLLGQELPVQLADWQEFDKCQLELVVFIKLRADHSTRGVLVRWRKDHNLSGEDNQTLLHSWSKTGVRL